MAEPVISPTRRLAVVGAALYGLRWALTALRTQRRLTPLAAAGDPAALASVTQRPEASLLGVPNSAYGVAYYLGLLTLGLSGALDTRWGRRLAVVAAVAALARSLWLLGALARSATWCAVCMRAHVTNAALALLLLPTERA